MRFYCIVTILLLLMPASVSAYTVESNRERANEVYQLAMTSGRMFPKETTENGKLTRRTLKALISEMYVEANYFRDIASDELVSCNLAYRYESVIYLYHDAECNGEAFKVIYKGGKPVDKVTVSVAEYARVLNVMHELFGLIKNLNKDVANARFTILPDFKNMDATLAVMQNMVYVFEDFPEFNHDGGIIINSETGMSQGSKYTFKVTLIDYEFSFTTIKRPNTKYEECLFYRTKSNGASRSWWDPDCDGAYEYYSEHGDERFLRPKDEGSYVALMMLGLMQQTHDFMQVYAELLELPR